MTSNQMIRKGRVPKTKKINSPLLERCPFRKGICIKVTVKTPKKPNSALRKVALLSLSAKNKLSKIPQKAKRVWVYIPGEKHSIKEHATITFRGGACQDVPGVGYTVVRGTSDAMGVEGRKNGRSLYGTKRPKG